MTFARPEWFMLLPLALLPMWRASRLSRLAWPGRARDQALPRRFAGWPRFLPLALRTLTTLLVLTALARPQTPIGKSRANARGVTIVVALDTSRTMTTTDIPSAAGDVSRLDAAKRAFVDFVERRPDDLIGLVGFANYPDTTCPPTLDHAFLIEAARGLPPARAADAGTNLGDALAWALRDARETSSTRRAIVLITDGENEPGVEHPLDPIEAARLARQFGVAVHVIAIVPDPSDGTRADVPPLLASIAESAGGRVDRAADAATLEQIFESIDRLERRQVSSTLGARVQDWFPAFLWAATACLMLEPLLAIGRFQRLP